MGQNYFNHYLVLCGFAGTAGLLKPFFLASPAGQKLEVVLHGSLEDNHTVYQSLNKKIPETPVYQSLKKGQNSIEEPNFKPQPGGTGQTKKRTKVLEEPVYVNSRRQMDAELGNMPQLSFKN